MHQAERLNLSVLLLIDSGFLYACGAVGFVTHCQRAGRLGGLYPGQGLVGTEHNCQDVRPADRPGCGPGLWLRDSPVLTTKMLIRAASTGVRADAQVAQGQAFLDTPFPHLLRHQGDGWYLVQSPASQAHQLFRNPERNGRLAGTTGAGARDHSSQSRHLPCLWPPTGRGEVY